jgi:glycosyltransferase A (GT-A) superfamily protein (DUF2064 family)
VTVQLFGYAVDGGWWLLGLAAGVMLLAALNSRTSPVRPARTTTSLIRARPGHLHGDGESIT